MKKAPGGRDGSARGFVARVLLAGYRAGFSSPSFATSAFWSDFLLVLGSSFQTEAIAFREQFVYLLLLKLPGNVTNA